MVFPCWLGLLAFQQVHSGKVECQLPYHDFHGIRTSSCTMEKPWSLCNEPHTLRWLITKDSMDFSWYNSWILFHGKVIVWLLAFYLATGKLTNLFIGFPWVCHNELLMVYPWKLYAPSFVNTSWLFHGELMEVYHGLSMGFCPYELLMV